MITILVATFSFTAFQRNFVWSNDLALWSDVVKKSPYKARGYNEIGMYFYELQKPDKAIPYFRKSLYYEPEYAVAHNNLGLCFLATGLIDLAIYEFRHAIKVRPLNGMYHVNLGIAYLKMGWPELANREIKIGKTLRRKYPGKQ
ncbi:MAG: hypothetical protein KKC23_02935 [Proteobacteria bacterium]|nr:hypothetical protein [Pseudomonadota bacterium]